MFEYFCLESKIKVGSIVAKYQKCFLVASLKFPWIEMFKDCKRTLKKFKGP